MRKTVQIFLLFVICASAKAQQKLIDPSSTTWWESSNAANKNIQIERPDDYGLAVSTEYFPVRKIKQKGLMREGVKVGRSEFWYESGNPMQTIEYQESRFAILEYYDSTGAHLVSGGRGMCDYYDAKPEGHWHEKGKIVNASGFCLVCLQWKHINTY